MNISLDEFRNEKPFFFYYYLRIIKIILIILTIILKGFYYLLFYLALNIWTSRKWYHQSISKMWVDKESERERGGTPQDP